MKNILITGGAGFIGVNTAYHYLAKGDKVTIFDNLSRRGTAVNLKALQVAYPQVTFIKGDIREVREVGDVVRGQDIIFHFAGQVAVTTSVKNPREDFEINTLGAFNVLEAVRSQKLDPIIIYSSTNKVYGDLAHLRIKETPTRYEFVDRPHGVSEDELLDFHSPYGCSKGAADQYMHDYHRIYGLRTIVFRQSCIYGPHQFGVEDQGWVAWFLIAALLGKSLTIYGNGKQVRDILYIDDLIDAYEKAIEKIDITAGQVYNIGGGVKNSISIWKEFGLIIQRLGALRGVSFAAHPSNPDRSTPSSYAKEDMTVLETTHRAAPLLLDVTYQPDRPGDQPIFIADTKKALKDFGWKPKTEYRQGIEQLYLWFIDNIRTLK